MVLHIELLQGHRIYQDYYAKMPVQVEAMIDLHRFHDRQDGQDGQEEQDKTLAVAGVAGLALRVGPRRVVFRIFHAFSAFRPFRPFSPVSALFLRVS